MKVVHKPLVPNRILYPAVLPPPERRRAISKAVKEVVSKMKPRSLCQCGEFCALDRELRK